MADVTRRRTGELLRTLFEILLKHPEGLQAGVALGRLADSVTLSEYEAGLYESTGTRRFEKIVRFATVDCVKAGWLLKHKGTWFVTEAGITAFAKFPDPELFYKEAVRLYRAWKSGQRDKSERSEETEGNTATVEQSASITFEQAEEQAWLEIEQYLISMKPYDFQDLVADLVEAMDYHVAWVAPPGKDGGVDIIAYTDPLGTKPPRVKIQVKRRTGKKVDIDDLKSFTANIHDGDLGLYVSTTGFTRDAEEFARNQERRKVTLIDLEQLVDLWVDHFEKLADSARRRLPLTPIFFLKPDD